MFFEEEGQSSYSKKNKSVAEAQQIELGYIKQLFSEYACNLDGNDGPFTIADFGTADGYGFIQMIPELVDLIRSHFGADKQISVILEDLPENDYKSMFKTFQGITCSKQNPYLAEKLRGVYLTASGTSFYEQCVPDNTLSLVCSSTALQCLSLRPCETDDMVPWFSEKNIWDQFIKQGEQDFENFLLHRAKELKKGGLMVLFNLGIDENGSYTGSTGVGNLYKAMNNTLHDITNRGVIAKEEATACTFDSRFQRKEDIMEPFKNEVSPVRQAGLKVVGIEKVVQQSPYYQKLVHSDAYSETDYAAEMIDSIKPWSAPVLYRALHQSRPEMEKQEILQQYFLEMEDIFKRNAMDYVVDYIYYAVTIVKE